MIVTCPGCGSKYRVRDEAVPPGGAELKCPSCGAVFVAHPPKHSEEEITTALEKITKAKEAAEARVLELERTQSDHERRAHEAEARVQQLEAQVIVMRSELQGAQVDARSLVQPLEAELQRLRDENARLIVRANAAQDAELRVLQMTEEVARARAQANHAPEVDALKEELLNAQKTTGRMYTDLDVAQQTVQRLQDEVERLKSDLQSASRMTPSSGGIPGNLAGLVSAVGPMLWGLEQAIKYLEPFGGNEPALASHVKQLQLLEKVLQRLAAEASN